jgi:hypothetical protein
MQDAPSRDVSRWGEGFVSAYLHDTVAPGSSVVWENEQQERGFDHDIKVLDSNGAGAAYVKVKSTTTTEKMLLAEVSHKEWLCAQQEGGRYYIYWVYGAGSPNARITRIRNPYVLWRSQKVGMCLAL